MKEIATKSIAKYKSASIGPKKVAPIMDIVRGKDLKQAKIALTFKPNKAAKMILKTLNSAEANAINNHNMNKEKLYISEIYVTPGRITRSWKAGSKGRVDPIAKRSSHIYVSLEERN